VTPENPYQAPTAVLGGEPASLEDDLSPAVEGFLVTRLFIRVIAVLSLLFLVFGVLGIGATVVMSSPAPRSTALLGVGSIVFFYGVVGIALYRLSSPLYLLAEQQSWANVTLVLQRMTQTWMLAIAAFVFGFLGGMAISITGPMTVIAGTQGGASDTVAAAQRLRNTIRIFVFVALAAMTANFVMTSVAPTAQQAALGMPLMWGMMAAGALIQLLTLYFVWQHVPALDAFIGQPSAATLERVAHAHRMLWRLVLVFVLLMIAIAVIGVIAALNAAALIRSFH
jgi:hypothetical protein